VKEPIWLKKDVLLAVHERLLAEHGGSSGFIDGNKRTGFMAAYLFLGRNGYEFTAEEKLTYFASALAAACWKSRRTSLASLFGKFERCTIRI
jgi:prophage maintenance system killer protein